MTRSDVILWAWFSVCIVSLHTGCRGLAPAVMAHGCAVSSSAVGTAQECGSGRAATWLLTRFVMPVWAILADGSSHR
ncbi:hypothetical protein XAP412_1430003 [Xanthomonas phaseoli pv. phaseoli]|uniref:Secreted protein n=1 Tax=Xanthomonas campestris pv. phaseoli TaxID=317013 RepID=A0AB38DXD1_XANCH|nr:hypothetical protein XAP6984_1570004 [Xanthomonas phaseoli pv. phaseoli]SON80386.1 hypothetical protein XAP412_1430003 [Xanthomonas phaseoli pv. phaseoli]SON83974.1 hypothetical protein XAP7430_1500002 [Xanthomonas phaseoli pv. phaseoli]